MSEKGDSETERDIHAEKKKERETHTQRQMKRKGERGDSKGV